MSIHVPHALSDLVEHLSRRKKQVIALITDAVMLPVALWSALALRLGELTPDVVQFWPAFVVSALICVPVFASATARWSARGNHAMPRSSKASRSPRSISAVAYMVLLKGFPRSVPIISG
jgi:hypothetical protein